jgi:hypothetical protein
MNDSRREGMTPWQFTFNWFVAWRDCEWDRRCVLALFVGR